MVTPSLRRVCTSIALRITFACGVLATAVPVFACPFCGAPVQTLSERRDGADLVLVGRLVSSSRSAGMAETRYELLETIRKPNGWETAKRFGVPRFHAGLRGTRHLLFSADEKPRRFWEPPEEIEAAVVAYLDEAPDTSRPVAQRLKYFAPFLEHDDTVIAADAFSEFANARYEDIVANHELVPRSKLREWIKDPQLTPTRLGLYGLLLGLHGNPADAELLEEIIADGGEEVRLGIDGVLGGYLVLRGDDGLTWVEKHLLANPRASFSDTFSAMQALRFCWDFESRLFEQERLRAAMRLLLDNDKLADLAVTDLTRWSDWSIRPRLIRMFADRNSPPSLRRAIVRHFTRASRSVPVESTGDPPRHVRAAEDALERLRKRDPAFMAEMEQFDQLLRGVE